jgi:uncharacterized damage-inducible protein DinB
MSDTLAALLTTLVEHNEWADNKILDAADPLSDDELGRKHGVAGTSIRRTLIHTVGTQLWWLSNWTGEPMRQYARERSAMREGYGDAHAGLRAFLQAKTPDDWARPITWSFPGGEPVSLPLYQTLMQVLEHSVQHRAEIAALLTELGRSPGDLDYIQFQLARQ